MESYQRIESGATGAHESQRSPYVQIPAIELVRREFCATNPVGTLISDLVRDIAARIGRSAGAITPALKRLQNDGWISYLADAHGMLIEVLRSDLGTSPLDQAPDRVAPPSAPPARAESAAGSHELPLALDQAPDRDSTALGCDQTHDRSACMVDHDSCLNNSSNMRAREEKTDWAQLTISGADFIPTAALEKAGHTPESVAAADAKILTRREYDRPAQVRILFQSLLTHQPIYSAAEIAARSQEPRHERPAERAARRDTPDHAGDRAGRSNRRQDSQRPRAAATRFSRESYRGCAHD